MAATMTSIDEAPRRPDDTATAASPELPEFLCELFELSGMDFRGYASNAVQRRVLRLLSREGLSGLRELSVKMRSDPRFLSRLIDELTLRVTSMFRDPAFFRLLREEVVPVLRTYPYLRLWIAGCSTGQEAYSLAIILREEGLHHSSRIYATDINGEALEQARRGLLPLVDMMEYERNYYATGGVHSLARYCSGRSNSFAVLDPAIVEQIAFFRHDLVSDGSFNEFQLILCRNVLIYFDAPLRERVHRLFHDSLAPLGFLGLGRGESLRLSGCEQRYEALSKRQRVYRRAD
jgi:chemotaxis protein methyltransferase CheR